MRAYWRARHRAAIARVPRETHRAAPLRQRRSRPAAAPALRRRGEIRCDRSRQRGHAHAWRLPQSSATCPVNYSFGRQCRLSLEISMRPITSRQVILRSRPTGIPEAENFAIVESPVPPLEDGQILVRNVYLSAEPAMRGWVSAAANYSEPVPLGSVMRSPAVGRVEESRHPDFGPREFVTGFFGWQDYAVVDASAVQRKVPTTGLPISTALGVLGINGLTAYFALLDVGQPRAGETVVVSTAAGAVGSCVGQIAKINGCRTGGIAGGPRKTQLCRDEFCFDAGIDYHAGALESALAAGCPHGIDIYYDNTPGAIS